MSVCHLKRITASTLLNTTAFTLLITSPIASVYASNPPKLDEIVVTATKKADAEKLQDVPIAITAYGEDQLEELQFRDLQSLSYDLPNVALDDIGTRGIANFSFRGLGINSSIPSIDPTVGVFVDGVYLGSIIGAITNQFDVQSVEILRGPQGVLFGRNVTGGAVVVNTKNPSHDFEGNVKVTAEEGLNKYISTVLTGPIIQDKLLGKIAVYQNDDQGYFKNKANSNNNFGQLNVDLLRAAITYFPSDTSELTIKFETAEADGDGPAAQNNGVLEGFERDTFDFAVNDEGFFKSSWDFLAATYTLELGDGTLTNIFGWRDFDASGFSDFDGLARTVFNSLGETISEQLSNETRYNISLLDDAIDLTVGSYYFTNEVTYIEERDVSLDLGIVTQDLNFNGGGNQDQTTIGLFSAADWMLTDSITLIAGIRFTSERKKAEIAKVARDGSCSVVGGCSSFDFIDSKRWSNWTPKAGIQWFINDTTQTYFTYTKGFRSGGYNLRNTTPSPAPFDEEEQDSFEIGLKTDMLDGLLRFNAAAFYNELSDLQRETSEPDPDVIIRQIVRNTADATITGFEMELMAILNEHLLIGANYGYLDGDYDKVLADLNGDDAINDLDKALDLPRLAQESYGIHIGVQTHSVGTRLQARLSFNHRDESAATDNNRGTLDAADMIDLYISLKALDDNLTLSLFGRNLKDEVTHGTDQVLSADSLFAVLLGGEGASFTPLNKGRVVGAEFSYEF